MRKPSHSCACDATRSHSTQTSACSPTSACDTALAGPCDGRATVCRRVTVFETIFLACRLRGALVFVCSRLEVSPSAPARHLVSLRRFGGFHQDEAVRQRLDGSYYT